MSSKACKCGGSEIDTDRARGVSVCMKCGEVIEDTCIVNEAELTETSGGGIQVVGQWLSNDDVRGASTGGMMGFNVRESRQITLQKARRGIMDIASNMRMNHHCVDAAFKVRKHIFSQNKFFKIFALLRFIKWHLIEVYLVEINPVIFFLLVYILFVEQKVLNIFYSIFVIMLMRILVYWHVFIYD